MTVASSDLENLKRLSLRWIIRKGLSLAEAEDIFQQSILKALTTEAQLHDQEKIQSWFMSILKNTVMDHFRKTKLQTEKNKIYEIEQSLNQESEEVEGSFCQCVKGFLTDLPETEKSLIEKHFFEGKTFAALAHESKTNESNLRVKTLRAREKLKEMYRKCCNIRKFKDLSDCNCT